MGKKKKAKLQKQVNILQEMASTQFAGGGLTIPTPWYRKLWQTLKDGPRWLCRCERCGDHLPIARINYGRFELGADDWDDLVAELNDIAKDRPDLREAFGRRDVFNDE